MTVRVRPGVDKSKQKITLRLPMSLHKATQEAVSLGLASTQNAFIEDAIRLRAREIRHARMRKLAQEAMNDPGFVADMRDTMAAFEPIDLQDWPSGDSG